MVIPTGLVGLSGVGAFGAMDFIKSKGSLGEEPSPLRRIVKPAPFSVNRRSKTWFWCASSSLWIKSDLDYPLNNGLIEPYLCRAHLWNASEIPVPS